LKQIAASVRIQEPGDSHLEIGRVDYLSIISILGVLFLKRGIIFLHLHEVSHAAGEPIL
jgi:hypothetical protein